MPDEASEPKWTTHRARVASLSRSRAADDPELLDARRDLKAARLEDHIRKALASAPELGAEQMRRIARLLAGGDSAVWFTEGNPNRATATTIIWTNEQEK